MKLAHSVPPVRQQRFLNSFGRRVGKRLGAEKKGLLTTHLPDLALEVSEGNQSNPRSFFSFEPRAVWLEIGFGSGEFLAEQIKRNPEIGFIGCEPYLNGVAAFLKQIQGKDHKNVRIWADDARDLLQSFTPGSIDKVFILFPDPWPKLRHHKRRIVSDRLLDMLAEKLTANGQLLLATDHKEYAAWMVEHVNRHPGFTWADGREEDRKTPPEGWVPTRYEEKTRVMGSEPVFLHLNKVQK